MEERSSGPPCYDNEALQGSPELKLLNQGCGHAAINGRSSTSSRDHHSSSGAANSMRHTGLS
jgi:hypothetical protein